MHPESPSLLRGDPGRLRQVLLNLADNALKFTKEGGVTIRVGVKQETMRNVRLSFSVHDTGIGIAQERLERLFEPFSQLDASTTRKFGGTGLGLTISRRLVELMKGTLSATSEEGRGTTFSFTALFEKQQEGAVELAPGLEIIRQRSFLVVDSNKASRNVVRMQVAALGGEVVEAPNERVGLVLLREALNKGRPFDVLIVGMEDPLSDQHVLARAVREEERLAKTALVLLTGAGRRGEAAECQALGYRAYLTQPVRHGHLVQALAKILGAPSAEKVGGEKSSLLTRHTLAEDARRQARILIAEDNVTNQQVAIKLLEKLGFQPQCVGNGEEALRVHQAQPFDLIFMDCQMPILDGFGATAQIRLLEGERRRTPIVAMTAYAMKGDKERCMEAQMDDYISKPVSPAALAEMTERYLSSRRSSETVSDVVADTEVAIAEEPEVVGEEEVFSYEAVLSRLGDDVDLLRGVVDTFLKEAPGYVVILRKALDANSEAEARKAIHSLRGAASTVGAVGLEAQLVRLSRWVHGHDFTKAVAGVDSLEQALDLFRRVAMERISDV